MPKATTIKAVIFTRANADGRHTIYIRITKQSKLAYISLDIAVKKEHFNPKGSIDNPTWISKKAALANSYNELIRQKLLQYESKRHEKNLTAKGIKEAIIKPYDKNDFIEFWQKIATQKGEEKSIAAKNKYKAECNKFERCFPKAKWSDITYDNIGKYRTFLLGINKKSTTAKSLEFLKEIVVKYVKTFNLPETENPFRNYTIEQPKGVISKAKQGVLTAPEVNQLESYQLIPGNHRFHAKNIFLSQMYAMGARIGEMLFVKNEGIKGDRMEYQMEKKGSETPIFKSVLITTPLRRIIDQYYNPNNTFLFPYMEGMPTIDPKLPKEKRLVLEEQIHNMIKNRTKLINEHLQEVIKLAGIEKEVTTHTARHTVAHILEQAGVKLDIIQNTLGHETPEETKNYLAEGKPLMVDDTAIIFQDCLRTA